jgi:hypothetical protein
VITFPQFLLLYANTIGDAGNFRPSQSERVQYDDTHQQHIDQVASRIIPWWEFLVFSIGLRNISMPNA